MSIFGLLYRLRRQLAEPGQIFGLYLILAGTERFLIEIIRTNREYLVGFTGAQIIGLAMLGIGGYLLIRSMRQEAPVPS